VSQLAFTDSAVHPDEVTFFAEVILPIPVPRTFTYRLTRGMVPLASIGMRVIVPLGKKKILTGVIKNISKQSPDGYEAKYIIELLDDKPSFCEQQFKLFEWIASYYMSTEGEALNVAMPAGLKLSSESKIQLHPHFVKEESPYIFNQIEELVLNLLKKEDLLSYQQIAELANIKESSQLIKDLLRKNAILLIEQVKDKYKPKTVKFIKLDKQYTNPKALEMLMAKLEKQPKQLDILLKYLQELAVFKDASLNEKGVAKKHFSEQKLSLSSLNTLVKNEVFHEFEKIISRLDIDEENAVEVKIELTAPQQECRKAIDGAFENHQVNLLHGVTGSGKTEVYLSYIKEVIESGSQALFLLPEIAITTQMIKRVQKIFGKQVGIYHSKFSDAERVEVWNGVADGTINFIIGVRSSIFLPFNNLAFIVVDEEHDNSYKQYDPSPRYHARDTAIMLAHIHKAKVLLGSATPSFESYFNAKNNKYGLVTLNERFKKTQMPRIEVIDLKKEKAKKQMQGDYSNIFIAKLQEHLEEKKQVIIFQNRRGYAPYIQCDTCGWIAECENCSVSLTYHMRQHELKCHYCGFRQKSASTCLSCESSELKMKGFGTEKIEDDLHLLFPSIKIQRMDKDTTRKKYSYQQIIEAFETGETQLLIGTQMVSKGLDFKRVSMVGIVDADRMMFYPDFRAHERAFQMMLQVSGRAGRDAEQGEVVIQTMQPDHPLFSYLKRYDYEGFYALLLNERLQFAYPPFYRLIKIIVKGKEAKLTYEGAHQIFHHLLQTFGPKRLLAPHEPMISKINNIFHQEILLKLEKGHPLDTAKHEILKQVEALKADANIRKLRIYYDVDPA
jgi:primosomal protein N' (replication factor Y)